MRFLINWHVSGGSAGSSIIDAKTALGAAAKFYKREGYFGFPFYIEHDEHNHCGEVYELDVSGEWTREVIQAAIEEAKEGFPYLYLDTIHKVVLQDT